MLSLTERREKATTIVNRYAMTCAGTAAVTGPIPGTSIMLTGVEATMAFHIARVYDFYPTITEAGTVVTGLLGAGVPLKILAELATAIPIIGWWIAKPALAASTCKAVGQIVIGHYEQKYQECRRN
jgi:uncharacterized protein (DUF697 family)